MSEVTKNGLITYGSIEECRKELHLPQIINDDEKLTSTKSSHDKLISKKPCLNSTGPDPTEKEAKDPNTDGGWAWVVFVAVFLDFTVASGIYYSQGVFFVPVLETFGESRSLTAWAFSINSATHSLAGPLASLLVRKTGPRTTMLLAGLLAALGYLWSAFADSLFVMYMSLGVINGVGTCLNYTGAIVGLTLYFKEHRSLIMGLAMAGSGLGVSTIGPAIATFVPKAGWRESMILCAGLSLTFALLGIPVARKMELNKEEKESKKFQAVAKDKCIMFWTSVRSCGKSKKDIDVEVVQKYMDSNLRVKSENRNQYILNAERAQWKVVLISSVLNTMAVSAVYALVKDWIKSIGLEDIMPLVLVMLGVGDILGRILAGVLSWLMKRFRSSDVILFGGAQLVLTAALVWASTTRTKVGVLGSVLSMGITGGFQMVLTAVSPMKQDNVDGLGIILLLGGIGALAGPPTAGFLADELKTYDTALLAIAAAPLIGTLLCLLCFILMRYRAERYKRTLVKK
ncbi:Major facilitator superfamily [Trinorchestia longiramus]|nr:Major facilitator superfamily [Trinorchestia longiramus]